MLRCDFGLLFEGSKLFDQELFTEPSLFFAAIGGAVVVAMHAAVQAVSGCPQGGQTKAALSHIFDVSVRFDGSNRLVLQ